MSPSEYISEHILICKIAKIARVTPVTDAWPELGASAAKSQRAKISPFLKSVKHILQ